MKRVSYYYVFEDGYFCWIAGRLSVAEKRIETNKHGRIMREQAC